MKQAGAVERFHREVEAAAKLSHPNIVTAYDAGEHQGMHYLAMEYVEGKDLASIVKDRGPLGVREAVECVLQAARGLQYAHEQGIVHRDIKPGNLLLDKKGTVKILDMGLARIAGADAAMGGPERLTTTGQVMGTCDYMAPEQAMDTHDSRPSRPTSMPLGCTLYRLLTGQPPYQGETLMQILMAHQQSPIPSLCQARPEVPAELDACFQRMVAKEPRTGSSRWPRWSPSWRRSWASRRAGRQRPRRRRPSRPVRPWPRPWRSCRKARRWHADGRRKPADHRATSARRTPAPWSAATCRRFLPAQEVTQHQSGGKPPHSKGAAGRRRRHCSRARHRPGDRAAPWRPSTPSTRGSRAAPSPSQAVDVCRRGGGGPEAVGQLSGVPVEIDQLHRHEAGAHPAGRVHDGRGPARATR